MAAVDRGSYTAITRDDFWPQIPNLVADLGKLGWLSDLPFIGPRDSQNRAGFTPTRPKISRQCLSVGRADFLSRGVPGLAFELAASQDSIADIHFSLNIVILKKE